MVQKVVLTAVAAALVMFASPSKASAHGVAHFGYTHVGPTGFYRAGGTALGGYVGGYRYVGAYGVPVAGYRYAPAVYGWPYGAVGGYYGWPYGVAGGYYGWPYGVVGGYGYIP
jgi:hypothetical protein